MTLVLAKRAHVENFTPQNYLPELSPRTTLPQKILNFKK